MKIVIQRVSQAKVEVQKQVVAQIGKGFVILVGISKSDHEEIIRKTARKVLKLRLFPDDLRDINLSIQDVKGEILVVSQFTLLADTSAGNRPSFIKAAEPERAGELFDLFVQELKKSELPVKTGIFGEYMRVSLVNEGPVTIIMG